MEFQLGEDSLEIEDKKIPIIKMWSGKYDLPVRSIGWRPTDYVKNCHRCQKAFSMFLWKHHCRICGHVICDNCSSFKRIGKDIILSKTNQAIDFKKQQRICKTCFHKIGQIRYNDTLEYILKKLPNYLGPDDIQSTLKVCKYWKNYIPYNESKINTNIISLPEQLFIQRFLKNPSKETLFSWESYLKKDHCARIILMELYNSNDLFNVEKYLPNNIKSALRNLIDLNKARRSVKDQRDNCKLFFERFCESTNLFPCLPNVKGRFKVNEINVCESATRPIIIPFIDVDQSTRGILLKYEDIRIDQFIIYAFQLCGQIIKKEYIDPEIVDYLIIPDKDDGGIIEIIPDSISLYQASNVKNGGLLNHLLRISPNESARKIRERFLYSCASSCVLSYIFGIGDRHLDNILIDKRGRIFHIDFGYCFGDDPKVFTPMIRLTQQMIDALGGTSSEEYKEFKKICIHMIGIIWIHRKSLNIVLRNKLKDLKLEHQIHNFQKNWDSRLNSDWTKADVENHLEFGISTPDAGSNPLWMYMIDSLHEVAKSGGRKMIRDVKTNIHSGTMNILTEVKTFLRPPALEEKNN